MLVGQKDELKVEEMAEMREWMKVDEMAALMVDWMVKK